MRLPRIDPYVAKASLAGTGLAAGLGGMAWRARPLIWVALALLSGAFLLRFWGRREPEGPDS